VSPPSDPSTWTLPRLRIARDGAWFHDDQEVTHEGILENLRDGLDVDEQGHYIRIGPVRVPVEVEDAPWIVVRVERQGDQLEIFLNDMTRERLRPETLRFTAAAVPYCRVKDGRFEARLGRSAAHQLLALAESDAEGRHAALVVGGRRHQLPEAATG